MNRRREEEELFSISVVADMLGVTPQTLRLYEAKGLLDPPRTEGGTRMYRRADLERLEQITTLIHEHGVNLAGVKVVLEMRDRYEALEQERLRQLQRFLEQLEIEFLRRAEPAKDAVVHVGKTFIVQLQRSRERIRERLGGG